MRKDKDLNLLMAIPNLIALLLLSTHVKNLALDVDKAQKEGTICEKDDSIR
ncbi:MAG: hypothetical protein Q4E51_07295 [Lachnospiraceae bacterium]|nr:hypothetical protein [Lachnospiraceae bacterium]